MIRCIDVRKTYRQGESEITALAGISLDIPEGSLAVIMGPSGSGKSTLLHLIGGLDRPSGGDLLVDGRLIGQMADDQVTLFRRKKIGIVFQFFNLLPTLSALENVALPLVLDGRSKAEANHQAEILLTKIGLDKRQHHLPEELSGGEIQRVAMARALAFNPPILLADEPTGNLDSVNGEAVMNLLQDLHRAGATICMVTHDPRFAKHAGRSIHLFDGRVVEEERGEERAHSEEELKESGYRVR
jgi:putative ABC transport system ATP-binding protein